MSGDFNSFKKYLFIDLPQCVTKLKDQATD